MHARGGALSDRSELLSKPSFQTATEPYNTTRHHSSVLCAPTLTSPCILVPLSSRTHAALSLLLMPPSSHPATLVVVVAHQTSSHKPPSLHTHTTCPLLELPSRPSRHRRRVPRHTPRIFLRRRRRPILSIPRHHRGGRAGHLRRRAVRRSQRHEARTAIAQAGWLVAGWVRVGVGHITTDLADGRIGRLDGRLGGRFGCRHCRRPRGRRPRARAANQRIAAADNGSGHRRARRGDRMSNALELRKVERCPRLVLQRAKDGDGDAGGGVNSGTHEGGADVGDRDRANATRIVGTEGRT